MNVVMNCSTVCGMTKSFACFLRHTGFCFIYSSTLKMKMKYSSETSVHFQQTTRHYIPEHRPLHLVKLSSQVLHNTRQGSKPAIPVLQYSKTVCTWVHVALFPFFLIFYTLFNESATPVTQNLVTG
jgi:hypothetical protein